MQTAKNEANKAVKQRRELLQEISRLQEENRKKETQVRVLMNELLSLKEQEYSRQGYNALLVPMFGKQAINS